MNASRVVASAVSMLLTLLVLTMFIISTMKKATYALAESGATSMRLAETMITTVEATVPLMVLMMIVSTVFNMKAARARTGGSSKTRSGDDSTRGVRTLEDELEEAKQRYVDGDVTERELEEELKEAYWRHGEAAGGARA